MSNDVNRIDVSENKKTRQISFPSERVLFGLKLLQTVDMVFAANKSDFDLFLCINFHDMFQAYFLQKKKKVN